MATINPRIQVTVDDELADALAQVDPAPQSRSRLVRDLALRGAQSVQEERGRLEEAKTVLLEIVDGTRDYDFTALAEVVAQRDAKLG